MRVLMGMGAQSAPIPLKNLPLPLGLALVPADSLGAQGEG